MKILMVVLCIALSSYQINAQKLNEGDVPEVLKNNLHQKFKTKDVDWDKEGENYEASFEKKGKDVSVLFNADGSILEVEREIKMKELPAAVKVALTRDFNGFDLKETTVIEANGQISYEAEVKKWKKSFDLIFDAQGNLKKKGTR
ncbi:MAG: hypothetical protein KF860_12695 [Cyclobacteriaceae bacterium]|nr:hypothetical protein [Cyclobacteriaceae bacterium]